ncbi:MAG: hypothetical protein U0V74_06025 [Chitinophagales bacterium]
MKQLVFLLLVLLCGCTNRRSNHVNSLTLQPGLYLEIYNPRHWGVYGGETVTYYLTDSSNFRKFLGYCDEKERIGVEINADSVTCKKYSTRNRFAKGEIVIDSFKLTISALKKEIDFD